MSMAPSSAAPASSRICSWQSSVWPSAEPQQSGSNCLPFLPSPARGEGCRVLNTKYGVRRQGSTLAHSVLRTGYSLDFIGNKESAYNSPMLTYAQLQRNRRKFLARTGLTVPEFELLLPAFARA